MPWWPGTVPACFEVGFLRVLPFRQRFVLAAMRLDVLLCCLAGVLQPLVVLPLALPMCCKLLSWCMLCLLHLACGKLTWHA